MWIIEDAVNNVTNKVVVPADGIITISKPDTASVDAYVNDAATSTQQVEVKAGDTVYFKLTNWKTGQTPIGFKYGDTENIIMLPGKSMSILKPATTSSIIEKENIMAEIMTPSGIMMGNGGGGDGLFGGGGLIGGLILGSLLRNNGNLLGGEGGAAGGAMLRSPPEQVTANMSLMQAIGAVDKSVAVNSAAFEASQASQSLGLTNQFNNTTAALSTQLMTLQREVMENRYELSKDITADGATTRALIVAQYEATLNRQLGDANAEIIALRNRAALDSATNGITLTNTNNINQMQQQTQQQAQYAHLANLIYGLGQNITNGAINVGSGTLTANPTNTNTSIR